MPVITTKDMVAQDLEDYVLGTQGIRTGSVANLAGLEERRRQQESKRPAPYSAPARKRPEPAWQPSPPATRSSRKVAPTGDSDKVPFWKILLIGFVALMIFGAVTGPREPAGQSAGQAINRSR